MLRGLTLSLIGQFMFILNIDRIYLISLSINKSCDEAAGPLMYFL